MKKQCFFHCQRDRRRRINEIACINSNDRKITGVQDIKQKIFDHFNCIGVAKNYALMEEFSEEEIKKSILGM